MPATESREDQVERLQGSTQELFYHCFQMNLETQWKALFSFINETCTLRPETFVPSYSSSRFPMKQDALLLPVFGRLLQVFSIPECRYVYHGAQECLFTILKLVEARNHILLCYLLTEITEIYAVLVAAQELNKEAALALPFHLLCFKSHFAGKQLNSGLELDVIEFPSLDHIKVFLEGIL
jgi:hypothetical protein